MKELSNMESQVIIVMVMMIKMDWLFFFHSRHGQNNHQVNHHHHDNNQHDHDQVNQRAEREQLERLANAVRAYKQENLMLKVHKT